MKNWLSFLLIVIASSVYSQSLPDSLLKPIAEELVEKDGLVYKINYQDSLITIYRRTISVKDEIIASYKLNETGYSLLISNKEKLVSMLQAENKDLQKQVKRANLKTILVTVGAVLVIIILL